MHSLGATHHKIETIIVSPEDWSTAGEDDQHEYESAASDRGIVLASEGSSPRDVLVVVRANSPVPSIEPVLYNCAVFCPRRAWEHQLRLLFDLDDPCFFWTSGRR